MRSSGKFGITRPEEGYIRPFIVARGQTCVARDVRCEQKSGTTGRRRSPEPRSLAPAG